MAKNKDGELVDFGGRAAPKMPDGYICVLIDDEWVARKANSYERSVMEEITLKQVATMISQMATLYPTKLGYMSDAQIAKTAEGWYQKLKGQDRQLVARAFNECTSIMSQPPVPADILKAIVKLKNGLAVR